MTLSQCRLRLRQLTQELNKLIMIFLRRKILIKGGVCLTRSRCGKVNCRCVKDDALHLARKLYWTEDGKTRQKTIGKGVVYDYQRLMGNYLRFRKARARFVKIYQEMIQLINLLEKGMTKSSIKSYWTRR